MAGTRKVDPRELAADSLLAALSEEEREGILLPGALKRRQMHEVPLAPILALRAGGASEQMDPEFVHAQYDICAAVVKAARLTFQERTVFFLHLHQGMTDAEIAEIVGLSRPCVHERRQSAVTKLREAYANAARDVQQVAA